MIEFIVQGEPVGKARPRVTRNGTYTPQKTKDYEQLVQLSYKQQVKQKELLTGEISVDIKAYFGIPKSYTKQKLKLIEQGMRPTKKPDLDNIYKAITDALNGIAYKDDSQIVAASIEKHYSKIARVKIIIKEN